MTASRIRNLSLAIQSPMDTFAVAFSCSEPSVETMTRLGYRLSYSALNSRRNSGLKITFSPSIFLQTDSVYPAGIVLLMTIMAFGFTFMTRSITDSTAGVSKVVLLAVIIGRRCDGGLSDQRRTQRENQLHPLIANC